MTNKDRLTRTFEYKLRLNRQFVTAALRALDASRFVYNSALEHRIRHYQATGKSLSLNEQSRQLTAARAELPEIKATMRSIQQDALERLDSAFEAFFRRLKQGEKPGFPRFKGRDRYHTFSQKIERQRSCPLSSDRLTVPGVGTVRVRLSRPIEGTVKQLRITRRADGWYVLLVCETARPEPLPLTGRSVGVDVGIKNFVTLSTGEEIKNPHHLKKAARGLVKLQRRLSRKQRGSKNRSRAKLKVARAHPNVARTRKDFHHQLSAELVKRFDEIRVEKLNIRGMVKNHRLAQAISDAAWGNFFKLIEAKAESAGRRFERVDARYTSQTCSRCGERQWMPLAVRRYDCGNCGLEIDRDHDAAINIGRGAPESTRVELSDRATEKHEQTRVRSERSGRRPRRDRVTRT